MNDLIFWISVLIPPSIALYLVLKSRFMYSKNPFYRRKPLNEHEYKHLIEVFPYFKRLSEKEQHEFGIRVRDFLYEKDFIGRGMKITKGMKLLVAAYATQISFGLDRTVLLHFKTVVIHPKVYRADSGRLHKGEVNPMKGAIQLSWPDLQHGLKHPDDGIDLGLHEMAHALWFEDQISNAEMDFLPKGPKATWSEHAHKYVQEMQAGKKTIFRKYAGVNTQEFFSVTVEHFFERSGEFLEHEPVLYAVLSELLGQDPARSKYRKNLYS